MNNMDFEEKIGYRFQDPLILERALTHSSYGRSEGHPYLGNNERLEFLGDAFFDAVVGVILYQHQGISDEGQLTKLRSQIVCESSLAAVGKTLGIGDHLNMGKGEILQGGRKRESILADALEAVMGAIYLDGGFDAVVDFVNRHFGQTIQDAIAGKLNTDYKTQVQEFLQRQDSTKKIQYILDRSAGPDHDKTFYVHLEYGGRPLGNGVGKSKKEAEQRAARAALERGE